MTMAKWVDIDITRGDTPVFLMDFTADLTGAKIWFTAKRAFSDADGAALIALSSPSSGVTILSVGPPGQARIRIPASSTQSLTVPAPPQPLRLVYDIQLLEADGTVTTVQQGNLNIRGDVTHSIA